MHFLFKSLLLTSIALLLPLVAHAESSVVVRYLEARRGLHQSHEWITLDVTRQGPLSHSKQHTQTQAVDRFFEQVSEVLEKYNITEDWESVAADGPSIKISMNINGRKIWLHSDHTLQPAKSRRKMDTEARRHAKAFEAILDLTLDRTKARLLP